jgi:predicted nucleic acid-binding protein
LSGSYVLDACALIAYFKGEEGHEAIARIFEKALFGEVRLTMSKYNLLEVYYGFYRDDGRERAEEVFHDALSLPVEIIDELDDAVFREAGRFKARYSLALADAVALGLAAVSGKPLVTGDREFSPVEKGEGAAILWFR